MVLVDEVWQGRPRKLLMHGNRNGMFYVLDRTNGQFLLADKLSTKVTWLKGFTPEGRPIVDPASNSSPEGSAVCPHLQGGANWQSTAYDPVLKLFFAKVYDSCGIYTSHEDPLGVTGNRWYGGGRASDRAQQDLEVLQADYKTGYYIRAMNPFTGKKVWDLPVPAGRSATLATAGGLIFTSGPNNLLVLDSKTGKVLRSINVATTSNGTSMSYMVGGRQYIARPGFGSVVAFALY